MTTTYRIGSLWMGQQSQTIEQLIDTLGRTPLDPRFEQYGNFAEPTNPGYVRFWGNFLHLSCVFRVDTNDADVIARLTAAIRANHERADYVAEVAFRQRAADEIEALTAKPA